MVYIPLALMVYADRYGESALLHWVDPASFPSEHSSYDADAEKGGPIDDGDDSEGDDEDQE